MGRVATDYYVQDGVVPRTRLPEVLRRIDGARRDEHGLRVGNVFHAGDGNLHPLVLYDASARARRSGREQLAEAILDACLDAGGSLTGEHGVGIDKACSMPLLFSERDLDAIAAAPPRVRSGRARNPGKVIPTPRLCGEVPGPYRAHPLERAGRCRASLSRATLEEAADVLAAAHAAGLDRARGGDDLSTDGSDRVLEHEPGDLTCMVEAGVRLSELREALAPHGQMLALDPPGDPTVGALPRRRTSPARGATASARRATSSSASRSCSPTARSRTPGGKVVKNVAGYDLGKLFCGSEGRLGLIARVALRLHPLPTAARDARRRDRRRRARSSAVLLRSQLQPSALDVLHPGRVAVLFEGSERAVAAQLAAAHALVGGAEADASVWDESRSRQASALGRVRFAPGDLPEVARQSSTRPSSVPPPASPTTPRRTRVTRCPRWVAAARRADRAPSSTRGEC